MEGGGASLKNIKKVNAILAEKRTKVAVLKTHLFRFRFCLPPYFFFKNV